MLAFRGKATLFALALTILPICLITACGSGADKEPGRQIVSPTPSAVAEDAVISADEISANVPEETSDSDAVEEPPLTSAESAGEPAQAPTASPSDSQGEYQQEHDPPDDPGGPINLFVPDDPGPPKVAYITIDDGPSRAITPAILDLLMEEGIKATFFVLPHSGLDDIYRRILDEGHAMGNHSYSHVYSRLYNNGIEMFKEDVLAARTFVEENFGYTTTLFRFPGGAMGRKASIVDPRKELLEELGYNWFDWNVTTGDGEKNASKLTVADMVEKVLANTRGRDKLIILMHDTSDKKTTLEALPYIIEGLRAQNYTFDILTNYYPAQTDIEPDIDETDVVETDIAETDVVETDIVETDVQETAEES